MRLERSGRQRPASLNAVVAEVAAAVLVHIAFWLLLGHAVLALVPSSPSMRRLH